MGNLLDLFVFKYNRTDFHELNLDWIISDIKTLAETLKNFISLNTIKYADPIQWDITTQYEQNTIVVEPVTGTAYLSLQPVPSGVSLSNDAYWMPIFRLDLLNQNITLRDDTINATATFASDIDDWLIWNGILYKVIQPITIGTAYSIGNNIERYTVELFINDIISYIDNSISDVMDNIGNLADLTTRDKTNIVSAINSLDAIYKSYKIVNVLYPPAITDVPLVADYSNSSSYTDNSPLFQQLVNTYGEGTIFYFPAGIYGFSNNVTIPYRQIGIIGNGNVYTRLHFTGAGLFFDLGSRTQMNTLLRVTNIGFVCDDVSQSAVAIRLNNPNAPFFKDLLFQDFSEDIRFEAVIASSGQTAEFNWITHSGLNRTTADCMFNFVAASNTIFPNGIFIDNCHGSFVRGVGTFLKGNVADLVVTRCNIAHCLRVIDITAGNPDVSGDLRIVNNMFTDCWSHAITIRHFNRAVIISENMIEQYAAYSGSVFAAFRVSDCNGVVISNNQVGTERLTTGINHLIAFLLCENAVKDFAIVGNVAYLGGYILIGGATNSGFIIGNNHFEHVGDNATQANGFYISTLTNSNIHDNRIKNFGATNSAYSTTGVYTSHNLIESSTTLNAPFVAADNYMI